MTKLNNIIKYISLLAIIQCITGCREDELVVPTEYDFVSDPQAANTSVSGLYLLNEGNMGSNKCTLDYLDFADGTYARNIYAERNPTVVKELGDVGNDIGIYGDKLYIVVNCSHKVEVLNARTGARLGQIDIPNPRYVRFHRDKAYVSAYVAPVSLSASDERGAVYQIDTLSLAITGTVTVGYQPEEMEIVNDYMYVANSGGYRAPTYDNTVSVLQLLDFKNVGEIKVDINLNHIRRDSLNRLWVNSRGDNNARKSRLYLLDKKSGAGSMAVVDTIDTACSNFAIAGNKLYFYATDWSDDSQSNTVRYGIVDINSRKVVSDNFITDGTEQQIKTPYGIAIHPVTGDIYLTDAKNYVSSGTLFCFSSAGKLKWKVRTGDIPAHMAFLYK